MTQPIGSYSTGSRPPAIQNKSTSTPQPGGGNNGDIQYGGYGENFQYGGGGYYPYASPQAVSPYTQGYGSTNNPQLNSILNLNPLQYDVYSPYAQQQYGDSYGYNPTTGDMPPPPSRVCHAGHRPEHGVCNRNIPANQKHAGRLRKK
jgi:hypothetical protein